MKQTFFVGLLLSLLALFSCSTDKTEKNIKLQNVNIFGRSKDYVKIVDGDYKLKVLDDKIVISLKVQNIKTTEQGKVKLQEFSLSPMDGLGIAVPDIGLPFRPATVGDWEKLSELLSSSPGTEINVSFEWSYFGDIEKLKRIMKETESFEITESNFFDIENAGVSSVDELGSIMEFFDENSNYDGLENDIDYDKLLDEYEKKSLLFVSKYGNALNGKSYISNDEYIRLLTEIQNLSAQLMRASAEYQLSADQQKRMLNINQKIVSKSVQMQGKMLEDIKGIYDGMNNIYDGMNNIYDND